MYMMFGDVLHVILEKRQPTYQFKNAVKKKG